MKGSPLRYPGGKSRAIDLLLDYIPDFKEYREPFIGGASIFLAVKNKFGSERRYVINDLYYETYNFWKMCKDNPKELIEQILKFRNMFKGKHNEGRELFRHLSLNKFKFNDIEKASSFFIVNRSSFSGMSKGFSDDAFKNRFTESSIDNLKQLLYSDIFKGVDILNLDYQKIIEAEPTDGIKHEDVFIFNDPPYYTAKSSKLYGSNNNSTNLHTWFDHDRFAKVMQNCKYRFLITYDDSIYIRKLFNNFNIVEYDLVYGMGGNKKSITNTNGNTKLGKEILISNMDIKPINSTKQQDIESAWT